MIRIGFTSYFLYMSIITLKKSALKDASLSPVTAFEITGYDCVK